MFSAVDMTKEEIRAIEEAYAKTETPVVSNNSAHRWTPDVPMVVPEREPGTSGSDSFPEKKAGNRERVYGSKAQLFYSKLYSGSSSLKKIRHSDCSCHHLSGHFRSGKNLPGLAGNGR